MKFYTWCNNSKSDKIQRLLDSAKLQHIDVETIGEGRDVNEGGKFNGKNLWLYEKVCELDENEIVVCTDSFDVIYLTNADEIKQKFLKMNTKIVYSAECLYNHQDSKFLEYYKKLGKGKHYKYLNSGALIGYAKNIKDKFEVIFNYSQTEIDESVSYNQGRVGKYIAENPNKVKLDYDCEIFWTDINFCSKCPQKHSHPKWISGAISTLQDKILVNGKMYNPITNSNPCVYHCPNSNKTNEIISTAWEYIKTTK
jgi:uncharacterized protein with PIN domain